MKSGDVLAWSLLSRTWAKLGQPLRSLRAEGESQYAMGDLRGAIDRLRAGQRLAPLLPTRCAKCVFRAVFMGQPPAARRGGE